MSDFFKALGELVLYVLLAAIFVCLAVLIGPGVFNAINFVGSFCHWQVYNVTDYSITVSDAVSYYLQALLAVVIAFVTIKNSGEKKVN